ncbi:MAG: hypothetical protein AB7J28_15465 [Hyphomonadaceae bacterium]
MSANKALGAAMAHREASDAPVQDQLIDALNDAALNFIQILKNEEKDEHGVLIISVKERMEIFKLATDWLTKSKRVGIGDEKGGEDMERYGALMQHMKSGVLPDLLRGLKDGSLEVVSKRGPGRPSESARLRVARIMEDFGPAAIPERPAPEPKPDVEDPMRDRLAALARKSENEVTL